MDSIVLYPSYFPSILQMCAVAQAKKVYFEVHDNFQKQTYRNRAYIAHSNGELLLNIPILKEKNTSRKTADIKPAYFEDWQAHHYKSIVSAYNSSPFYEYYIDDLMEFFEEKPESLLDYNSAIFKRICELIELDIEVNTTEEFLFEMPENTLDGRLLIDAKTDFKHEFTPYIQVFQENYSFIPNLSILDLLFNLGPNTLSYLQAEKIDFKTVLSDKNN